MEHGKRSLARVFVAGLLVFVPFQSTYAGKGCNGCEGTTGLASSALAPSPCLKSPAGDWEIAVFVDVYDGECGEKSADGVQSCYGNPCESLVTYTWGAEVADSGLSVGYYKDSGVRGPGSEFLFPDGAPWVPGQFGSVSFGPGNSPNIVCGSTLKFTIEGNKCGKFKAEVYGGCTSCGMKGWGN